ncbi:Fc.00g045710.m01.CDS01 [Cosmosporella sp. VM-42]
MLVKDTKRLAFLVGPILILLYVGVSFYSYPAAIPTKVKDWIEPARTKPDTESDLDLPQEQTTLSDLKTDFPDSVESPVADIPDIPNASEVSNFPEVIPTPSLNDAAGDISTDNGVPSGDATPSHHELFSSSTTDKKFFSIDFGGELEGMNPNIIPHPKLADTWIVVAQRRPKPEEQSIWFAELVCNAAFQDGVLRCLSSPSMLPVAATVGRRCEGDLSFFNSNIGPHDARVLFGPEYPYIVYGSNSMFTCFGQFIQDFRMLVDWGLTIAAPEEFRMGTELQRPLPWGPVEKNWFPFWDAAGQMYVHYDLAPGRTFAQVSPDGSVGPDLAPSASSTDEECLQRYFPKLGPELESIHQATNSLQITMCRKADPSCISNESNTFLFTIFQHKTYFNFHSVYEPYVMVFKQSAPFEIHAISRRPLWIHGREQHPDRGTSDMLYVTSMSWKSRDRQYQGYLDDELFVAFGVEDERAAGIDLLASDLLQGLGLCSES